MDDNNKIATMGDLNTLLPNTLLKFYSSEEFPFSNDQWCPTQSLILLLECLGGDMTYGVLVKNPYHSTLLVRFSDCSLKKRNLKYTITLNYNSLLTATGISYLSGLKQGLAAQSTTSIYVLCYSDETNLVAEYIVTIPITGYCAKDSYATWTRGSFPQTELTFDMVIPITHIQFGNPSSAFSYLDPNIIEIDEVYQSCSISLDVSGTIHVAS